MAEKKVVKKDDSLRPSRKVDPLIRVVNYINKRAIDPSKQISFKSNIRPEMAETYNAIYPIFLKPVERKIIRPNEDYSKEKFDHHPFCGIVIFSERYVPGTVILFYQDAMDPYNTIVWHGTNLQLIRDNKIFANIEDGIQYMIEIENRIRWR